MLKDQTLFGPRDLPALAIERIRAFESAAIKKHPDGYWVAFSGGKDSIVLLDLVRKAGVKHAAHFNVTTVDPPELMRYIRQHYPDVEWERPRITMYQLIVKKMMPPTRRVRYCCQELKERGGQGRIVVTGVRWAESVKRSKRRMIETCYHNASKQYLNPIIEWTDAEVWQYIRENNMPYCCLYDEGFKRVGCVGCPMAGKGRLAEFARWPRMEAAYRKAFAAAAAANRIRLGNYYEGGQRWVDGDAMWDWWINEDRTSLDDSDQCVLFE